MSVKVFQTNKAGKIEFSRCELEKLLNETYNEGYHDGENHAKNSYWTWTSPSISTTTYPMVTYRNSTEPIDNLTVDNATINNTTSATLSATDCSINTDELKKLTEQTHSNDKSTCQFDDMTINLNDLAKTVDAMLSGKYDFASIFANPISNTNVNGAKKAVEDNPFNNLAKELTTL